MLAIDSVVPIPEITNCAPQVEVPVKAFTEALEPAKEVPPACTTADTSTPAVEADPLADPAMGKGGSIQASRAASAGLVRG